LEGAEVVFGVEEGGLAGLDLVEAAGELGVLLGGQRGWLEGLDRGHQHVAPQLKGSRRGCRLRHKASK
jgi:hypothetical protein